MWSTKDGRLIATFRGHAGQITDIAINKENTFVASGSLDKVCNITFVFSRLFALDISFTT